MFLPNVRKYGDGQYSKAVTEKRIVEFKGINALPVIAEGEFSEMTNLSARNYPCLSPRGQRSVDAVGVSDMTSFDVVGNVRVWIRNNVFYYDGVSKCPLDAAHSSTVRQLVTFQDRIVIWPDNMYYDMTDDEIGSLEVSLAKSGLVFAASALDEALGNSVKYASIVASGAFTGLNVGDGIEITGCTVVEANNKTVVIDHVSSDSLTLYLTENAFADTTETSSLTISRQVPDMDYICVANNRVWGCKGNSLYGSKLGSAENWNNFSGISTDSYTVDVASPGEFTGCHVYGSYFLFLQADTIHKLLGTKPTNFQTGTVNCPGLGLEQGSNKSIAYISGILYVWHREDATQVVAFGVVDGTVLMLTDGSIIEMDNAADGEVVTWEALLGEFTEFSAGKKIHSKVRMVVDLPVGSALKIEYSADAEAWKTAWEGTGINKKAVYASIVP